MPSHLAAYDGNGSVVLLLAAGAAQPLAFPLAALLGSVHTYATDSDWQLQEVVLPDCTITYLRGGTGLLWASACSNALLDSAARTSRLQVLDAVVHLLLGSSAAQNMRSEVLKRYLRGVQHILQHVLAACHQWPLSVLPYPQQLQLPIGENLGGPTSQQQQQQLAALVEGLQVVAAAAGSSSSAGCIAAVLHQGLYLSPGGITPGWAALPAQEVQALQLLLAANIAEEEGQLRLLGLASSSSGSTGSGRGSDGGRAPWKLLWASYPQGLQVAVVTAADCSPTSWNSSASSALQAVRQLAVQLLATDGLGGLPVTLAAGGVPACADVDVGEGWATVQVAASEDIRARRCLAAAAVHSSGCRGVGAAAGGSGGYGLTSCDGAGLEMGPNPGVVSCCTTGCT